MLRKNADAQAGNLGDGTTDGTTTAVQHTAQESQRQAAKVTLLSRPEADALDVARRAGLDPWPQKAHGAGKAWIPILCPNGCDGNGDGRPHKRKADMTITGGWKCFRGTCGGKGSVFSLPWPHMAATARGPRPAMPARKSARMNVAVELAKACGADRGPIRDYLLLVRGWPEALAERGAELPDVAHVAPGPGPLARACYLRAGAWPLVIGLRDPAGTIRSAVRRWTGANPPDGKKSMRLSSESTGAAGETLLFGDLAAELVAARAHGWLFIAEGEMDWLALATMRDLDLLAGGAVGLPGVDSAGKVGQALRAALADGDAFAVVSLGDADPAGETMAQALADALGDRLTVQRLRWPADAADGYDLGDLIREHSHDLPAVARWIMGHLADVAPRSKSATQGDDGDGPELEQPDDVGDLVAAGDPLATTKQSERFLTELGNAERLVALHGPDLRYCWPWRRWLTWDGRRWAVDAGALVEAQAKRAVHSIRLEAANEPDAERRKALWSWARRSESRNARAAMLDLARSEPGIPVEPAALDRNHWALNAENGTVDLRTGKLRPHERRDLISALAPVAFDATAPAPTWDRFLLDIMGGRQHLVEYLARVLGYALTGDVREQALFYLYGSGANGKSTLLSAVRGVLGQDYAAAVPGDFLTLKHGQEHPTGLASLAGKRFIVTQEIEDGARLAESLLKQLTGGDAIAARRMREDFWTFEPTHKLFLSANHKLEIRGTDHAIWRRIRLIPFTASFAGAAEDKTLGARLAAERPGILAWLIRGCLSWQAQGLADPPEVLAAVKEYREDSDMLADFLAERCIADLTVSCRASELGAAFDDFQKATGGPAVKRNTFTLRLKEKGFRLDSGRRNWRGLGLLREAEK